MKNIDCGPGHGIRVMIKPQVSYNLWTSELGISEARVSMKDNMMPSESVPVKKVAETSDRVREDTTAIEENSAVPKELEKITLGEWFDRMERYLPKQINDITEEIIQSLRQRHKQFEEFIEQQRDGKGKLAAAN